MFVGPEAYCFTAGRGLAHAEQMLEILACVGVCQGQPFDSLTHLVTRHLAAVSGCICVLLDWDEARQSLVQRLKSLGIPLMVFVLRDAGASGVGKLTYQFGTGPTLVRDIRRFAP